MFKPPTPDSTPAEMAALTSMLPRLATLLNTDAQAKRLLEQARQGQLSERELVAGLAARLQAVELTRKT